MRCCYGACTLLRCYQLIVVMATASLGNARCLKKPASSSVKSKPNIVLILLDDVGWNDVGWHNDEIKTPNLNALVREGVELRSSYMMSICSPSRAALLSGIYPFRLGFQGGNLRSRHPYGLPLHVTLLPQRLRRLGYATHSIGKWHLGFCKWAYPPTFRGFDSFFGFYSGHEDYYNHTVMGGYDFRYNKEVYRLKTPRYSTTMFGKHAADIILHHKKTKPLFIYLALPAAHTPLQVPEKFENLHSEIKDKKRRKFSGMMSAADEAVGEVMYALKKRCMHKNTLVIFLSDNGGTPFGAGNNWPLRGAKSTLWEGGTRVPSFVWGHMINTFNRTHDNGLIHAVDWYPTIIKAAGGIPAPDADIDGVVQWNMLRFGHPSNRKEFVYNINRGSGIAALRWRDFKLIEGSPGSIGDWIPVPTGDNNEDLKRLKQKLNFSNRSEYAKQILLFNVKDDEIESNDLSDKHPNIVARMRKILKTYRHLEVKPFNNLTDSRKALPKFWSGTWSPGWC